MHRFFRTVKHLLLGMAVVTGLFLATATTWAGDKLTLKDGKVLEGTVVKELEGFVWFKHSVGGVEQTKMFTPAEIKELVKDGGDAAATKTDKPDEAKPAPAAPAATNRPGVPKAAVITMGKERDDKQGDMVGVYMTAYALDQMLPMLEEELGNDGSGVVVLRFNSGGGALLEIQRMSDVIHNKYKKKFRVVSWIDAAISAAAMTSHCVEEIYFTPQGNYGACTGWSGALVAVKGRALEEVLYMMEKISARGGYDPRIMRSMQIQVPLSCTKLPSGKVDWYQDTTSGEILVNRDNEILTFTAESALQVGFSKGTAATTSELAKLMGYQELNWVGENEPGTLWPVSKAEKWNNNYRRQAKIDETHFREYVSAYQLNFQAAAGEQDPQKRGAFAARAKQAFEKIKAMIRNNPNFMLFNLGVETEEQYKEWVEAREKQLRELTRK